MRPQLWTLHIYRMRNWVTSKCVQDAARQYQEEGQGRRMFEEPHTSKCSWQMEWLSSDTGRCGNVEIIGHFDHDSFSGLIGTQREWLKKNEKRDSTSKFSFKRTEQRNVAIAGEEKRVNAFCCCCYLVLKGRWWFFVSLAVWFLQMGDISTCCKIQERENKITSKYWMKLRVFSTYYIFTIIKMLINHCRIIFLNVL